MAGYEEQMGWLRQVPLLARLGEEDLALLARVAERRACTRGQVLVPRLRDEDSVFIVVRGSVRLYLPGPNGEELTLYRRRAGDLFLLGSFGPDGADETMAEVLVDGTVLYLVPWLRFLAAVASTPEGITALAELLQRRRAEERALLAQLAFFGMKARLAHKLAELAREHPQLIVNETRSSLAAMVGSRAEEVSKALYQLRDEGLIHFRPYSRRAIVVLRRDALEFYGASGT